MRRAAWGGLFLLAALLTGAFGWIAAATLGHLYADHLLIDAIRQDIQQRQTPQAPPRPPG